ncbi:putative iron-regulated membrane protein [Salegentibacter sp. 24]|uniref:PepSY-associated TM helix domain-containing protein n=1 Tax=Salegentibacter sp. 24 TaxID=2183986 RepID=UPI00105B90FD|nr:PepSY-associated TM helix domain-containing protein [Salegentibacter sp. 24]TDN83486.1 putative iron-regulated membrane protein [Salegentibacter sp. 24]
MKPFLKIVKKVHLYLGLSCGILASISGLTGSMYVWQPEITAALNPSLLQVETINNTSEETLLRTSRSLYEKHKDTVSKIFLPYREQQTISIAYTNGETLYYHPDNGMLLGQKSTSISFFEELLKIHRSLGIPEFGKFIVGGSAVLFFLFLLTSGFLLWWKKYKFNFKKGIKIKWKRNRKRFNYDVHKSLGLFFLLPLLLIAFSGGYFTYNIYYKEAFKLVDNFTENSKPEKKINPGTSLDILNILQAPDETYSLRAIYFPKNPNEVYQFRYIKDRFIVPGFRKTKELKVNQNGKIMNTTSFESDRLSEKIAAQMYPIHIGEIAGFLGRILVFISGFIPVILFITGLRFYYFRTVR